VLTIDAMEHIPPEDWPGVLANLRRAVRPGGLVYVTVEELRRHHIERALESLSVRGLPAVRGELAEPDAPVTTISRVVTRQWTGSASRAWRSSRRASGGKTGGATATSCCALARLRQEHERSSARSQCQAAPDGHSHLGAGSGPRPPTGTVATPDGNALEACVTSHDHGHRARAHMPI
jgi:hypothetical protein